MPHPTHRTSIERAPNKIAGVVYILIGFMALGVAAFVYFYRGTVSDPTSNIWVGFCIVISLYGLFRIYTGISAIRRANKMRDAIDLSGRRSQSKPTDL